MFANWEGKPNFETILETYKRNCIGSGTPPATESLCKLLEQYVEEADYTVMGMRTTKRTHKEDAMKCINEIKSKVHNSNDEAMNKVLEIITSMQLTPGSSFTLLLNTFFSVHPYLLNNRNDLRAKIELQDLWGDRIRNWLDSYKQAHQNNSDGNNYELLAAVSKIVPADKADGFADFLLQQLNEKERAEIEPGLYKGWVCLALGNLITKVSADKKSEITRRLLGMLESKQVNDHDICIIGICETLSRANLTTNEINKVTTYLYHYTTTQLPNITKLYADHLPITLKSYMPVIFNTLERFQGNYVGVLRSTIIGLISRQEYIYPFRLGICKLKDWFIESEKIDLALRLGAHEQFTTLQPLFWDQLSNLNGVASLTAAYEKAIENAKSSLMKTTSFNSRILSDMRVMLTDNRIPAKEHLAIMEKLRETLETCNQEKSCSDLRKEIHRALVLCVQNTKKNIDRTFLVNLAKSFYEAALPDSSNNDEMRLSAALAASEMREFLDNSSALKLRNTLLDLLYYSKSREAADVLLALAKNSPQELLPDLMTTLLAIKHNGPARFLLAQVHEEHQRKVPELSLVKNGA